MAPLREEKNDMSGAKRTSAAALVAACLLAAAGTGQAQQRAYKCVTKGGVTYSQVPCAGAREVGAKKVRVTDKWKAPPQDRATRVRRARLTPGEREECSALDQRLGEQQQALKAKGEGATLEDEMPLVFSKKRYRELKC
jgi:hypothetical protein